MKKSYIVYLLMRPIFIAVNVISIAVDVKYSSNRYWFPAQ